VQIDEYYPWQTKVHAAKALLNARAYQQAASAKDYQQLYLDLFYGTASGCAILASTPTTLGGDDGYATLWRSALCGLLPSLVVAIEADRLAVDKGQNVSTRECMACVVRLLFTDPANVLTGCEVMLASPEDKKKKKVVESEADMMLDVFIGGSDEGPTRHPVRAALLRSLEDKGLLHREDWKDLADVDAVLADWQDLGVSFLGEVGNDTESSSSLALLFEQKLRGDLPEDGDLLSRFIEDYASQQAFSQAVTKYICDCIESSELDSLAKVCKLLMSDTIALDIILVYTDPTQILHPVGGQLEDYELLQNEEEPAVVGSILLFAQLITQKGLDANYSMQTLLPGSQSHFLTSLVRSLPEVQVYSSLSSAEQSTISKWITALFGSEGIPDELIKNSSPQLMLRLSPTLFSQSVTACLQGVIDMDTLRGGLTYFLQDLLSYTLPSAIAWLLRDLSRCHEEKNKAGLQDAITKAKWARQSQIRMEILSMLLLSESCPRIVHTLVSKKVIEALEQYRELDGDIQRVVSELNNVLKPSRAAKTHLWIKVVQPSMPFCNVDSLLGLDTSIAAIAAKRGNKAALQVTFDTLLAHPKSEKLSIAVAMSLFLAHIARGSAINLADDIIISFTTLAMTAKYRIKSVILTACLAMEMLWIPHALMPSKPLLPFESGEC
jgi:mediator of RNA polymerase II transcription subunit 5